MDHSSQSRVTPAAHSFIPKSPTIRQPEFEAGEQQRLGQAWNDEPAETYHRVRPGYDPQTISTLMDSSNTPHSGRGEGRLAIDIGAGTGHMTDTLDGQGWETVAIDPSEHMLGMITQRHPELTTYQSTLEDFDTEPYRHRAHLVVAAQSWHWVDPIEGTQKVLELLHPQGVFGIVHHQIDTSIPWSLRLCRIMHSGDVHPVEEAPKVSAGLSQPKGHWFRWRQHLAVPEVHELMTTRAFYLKTNDRQRNRMHTNLQWYLTEHLGYTPADTVAIPYVTSVWAMTPA